MPLPSLTLFCMPSDVVNAAGIAAIQLREDDGNLASGQVISTTALASAGATALAVGALQYPLLKGTVLSFNQGGMSEPVDVTLSAAAAAGAVSLAVSATSAAIPATAQATDNGVNVWQASLCLTGCRYATEECSLYLASRYDVANLSQSWMVNRWATTIALRWVAKRRYQAAPQGIESDYEEAKEQMKAVQMSKLNLPNIAPRTSSFPFMSNVTIDMSYWTRRVRVQPSISEPTQTQYPQSIDYNSILYLQ